MSPEDHESGRAAKGFTCNTELVGSYTKPNAMGTVGGFKVERYVDAAGHDCAYYDTTLMYPTNLFGPGRGRQRPGHVRSSAPVGFLGHESGMAPDGNTFYSASPSFGTLVAVDISNPSAPRPWWFGNYDSHGLSISDDGNRAYVAGIGSGLIILDTSQVQARVVNPSTRCA